MMFARNDLVFLQTENAELNAQLTSVRNTRPVSARLSSQLEKFRHGNFLCQDVFLIRLYSCLELSQTCHESLC